jgi:hypothetical protein
MAQLGYAGFHVLMMILGIAFTGQPGNSSFV